MLKLPPELMVHRSNVFYLLYVAGGLLMTATAGTLCVDVAVRTAQDSAKLLRLSNTLIRLMGLRQRGNSVTKRQQRRLYFTESLNNLLEATQQDVMRVMQLRSSPERCLNHESMSVNCTSAKRFRIYYILIWGVSSQPTVTLCVGDKRSKLTNYSSSNLQWLVDFSTKTQERGDIIVLLVDGRISQIGTKPETDSAKNERRPTHLTLGLSALSVILLWMFLPHIALCAVVLLSWKLKQHNH